MNERHHMDCASWTSRWASCTCTAEHVLTTIAALNRGLIMLELDMRTIRHAMIIGEDPALDLLGSAEELGELTQAAAKELTTALTKLIDDAFDSMPDEHETEHQEDAIRNDTGW